MGKKPMLFLMVIVLLVAAGLRMHRLALDSVWWDEGVSVWMARMPIGDMLLQTANDTHPPLSYMLLHGWRLLVGEEEFALRMQSVLFGVLTVAVTYQIGRVVGDRRVGTAAAALTALAALTVWWSQEIRMYALSTLLAVVALWAALQLFVRSKHPLRWSIGLGVSIGLGLLTFYLFASVVLALNLAFAIAFVMALVKQRQPWELLKWWAAAQAIGLVFFVPWLGFALQYAPTWSAVAEPVAFGQVVLLYLSTIFTANAMNIEQYLPLLIIGLLALLTAVAVTGMGAKADRRVIWAALLVCLILPPALVYMLALPRAQFYRPTPSPRYFLLLAVPVYVLIAWGAVRLGRYAGAVLLTAVIALSAWSLNRYYSGLRLNDDYLSMVDVLEAQVQPGDAVVLNNDTDWPIFTYHYPYPYDRHITKTQVVRDEKYAAGLLNDYRNSHTGLWLVQTPYAAVTDPNDNLVKYITARSWLQARYTFPEGELLFFALGPDRANIGVFEQAQAWPGGFHTQTASIAPGVELAGYTRPVPETPAGSQIVIGLGWQAEGVQGEWPAAIKLIGADGSEIVSTPIVITAAGSGREQRFRAVEVFVPVNAPGGNAQIVFAAGESWQPLDTIRILPRGSAVQSAVIPQTADRVGVRFGDLLALTAANLPDQTVWRPGERIPLTLYWQAEQPIAERYKVFVHVVGEAYNPDTDNTIWGQQDQEPRGGTAPTTAWFPGAVVEDGYLVPIREDAPPGMYEIRVGLYDPLSGLRLPTPNSDSIRLLTITIAED